MGDTVLTLLDGRGARGTVERLSDTLAVVRRDDGRVAVARTSSLVVQRRVRVQREGRAS